HQFSSEEIEALLYHKGDDNIFKKIELGQPITINNAFSRYLQKHQSSTVLDYLTYAKYCEINAKINAGRSEEQTSELQSRFDLVYLHSFPTRRSSDLPPIFF